VAADPSLFLALGLASEAWLRAALPTLLEAGDRAVLAGDALVHFDVRSDNLCLDNGIAKLIDWNYVARGNPMFDRVAWAPSLHYEGGPAPWELVPDSEGLAPLLSGYFAAQAGQPIIPSAPGVREVQRQPAGRAAVGDRGSGASLDGPNALLTAQPAPPSPPARCPGGSGASSKAGVRQAARSRRPRWRAPVGRTAAAAFLDRRRGRTSAGPQPQGRASCSRSCGSRRRRLAAHLLDDFDSDGAVIEALPPASSTSSAGSRTAALEGSARLEAVTRAPLPVVSTVAVAPSRPVRASTLPARRPRCRSALVRATISSDVPEPGGPTTRSNTGLEGGAVTECWAAGAVAAPGR
jgi:hypothetical protein